MSRKKWYIFAIFATSFAMIFYRIALLLPAEIMRKQIRGPGGRTPDHRPIIVKLLFLTIELLIFIFFLHKQPFSSLRTVITIHSLKETFYFTYYLFAAG